MMNRPKTGGRQKGTPNRRTQAVLDRLEEATPGYCPIVELAKIATDESTPLSERIQCHKLIACYVAPKVQALGIVQFERRNGLQEEDDLSMLRL